jgi:CD2 antigen cytoplasmic tail-binding protein 2
MKLMPFNLKDENEEGSFDNSGNYVWKQEEKKVMEDAWLEGVSSSTMTATLQAKVHTLPMTPPLKPDLLV